MKAHAIVSLAINTYIHSEISCLTLYFPSHVQTKRRLAEQREKNKKRTGAQKHRKTMVVAVKAKLAAGQGGTEENEEEAARSEEEGPTKRTRRTRASRT